MTSSRRHGFYTALGVAVIGALVATTCLVLAAEAKPGLAVLFETQLPYYYEGDDLLVSMTVKNTSGATVDNAKGLDLLAGLQVSDARGNRLKPAEGVPALVTQPKSIEESAYFGRVLNINKIFPGLMKQGNYQVTWKGDGASSNSLVLHIVERYDPKKDYRAKIETEFGNIVIELNKEAAPRHVRNFVDLIREGFYNGNQFHRVIPGQAIIAGSPTGDPSAGSGYNLDPELSSTPIVAGAVVQVRNRETGAMDSGAHFMITAITKQDLTGRMSVLGKVVEGMDTVKTLCQVPVMKSPGEASGSPARPVKPILIKRVTLIDVTGNTTKEGAAKPAAKSKN